MSNQARIQFRLPVREELRAKRQAQKKKFKNLSEYCRFLLEQDLAGSPPRQSKEFEILQLCTEIKQKLEKDWGAQQPESGDYNLYEKLRTAIVASALFPQDKQRLRVLFAELFQKETKV